MAAQTKVFRLTSIASDLISLAKAIATAEPQLIVLDVMPDERDRVNQQTIVFACSVLMLIDEEMKTLIRANPITCQTCDAMHDTMFCEYYDFDKFLSGRFVWKSQSNIFEHGHCKEVVSHPIWGAYNYRSCDHYILISRVKCDSFAPNHYLEGWPESNVLDTVGWLSLVTECNRQSASKLKSYKWRYFVRSYFFLALDCSIPVVEAVDIVLFHLSKN